MKRSLVKNLLRDTIAAFTPRNNTDGIRILTYHSVSSLGVRAEDFSGQMEYVKKNFEVVSLRDFGNLYSKKAERPLLAITFDDGYVDNYDIAFPIMARMEIPFTIFLVTGFLGEVPPKESNLYPNMRLLSEKQIMEMTASGLVSFARHSHKHIDFSRSNPESLEKDIAENKRCIQQICGRAGLIDCLAYPFGRTPKDIIDKMDTDLRYAFIVDNRVAELDFAYPKTLAISRIHIDSQDNIVKYKWKLSSKYRSVSALARSIRGIVAKDETQ